MHVLEKEKLLSTFTITFQYKVKLLYNSKSTATGTLGRRISPAARPYTPTGNVFHNEKSQLYKIPPFPFPLLWTDIAGFFCTETSIDLSYCYVADVTTGPYPLSFPLPPSPFLPSFALSLPFFPRPFFSLPFVAQRWCRPR